MSKAQKPERRLPGLGRLTDWLTKAQKEPKVDPESLRDEVIAALRKVYDPEIPVNIYDLGLIYKLEVDPDGVVEVAMTLTAPGCPVAQSFPATVEAAITAVPGVLAAQVELVWDPPWGQERMSDEAKLELGLL
jgi:FeS assembly SUF system protein